MSSFVSSAALSSEDPALVLVAAVSSEDAVVVLMAVVSSTEPGTLSLFLTDVPVAVAIRTTLSPYYYLFSL